MQLPNVETSIQNNNEDGRWVVNDGQMYQRKYHNKCPIVKMSIRRMGIDGYDGRPYDDELCDDGRQLNTTKKSYSV